MMLRLPSVHNLEASFLTDVEERQLHGQVIVAWETVEHALIDAMRCELVLDKLRYLLQPLFGCVYN